VFELGEGRVMKLTKKDCISPQDVPIKSWNDMDNVIKSHQLKFEKEIRSPRQNNLVRYEMKCEKCGHSFFFSFANEGIGFS